MHLKYLACSLAILFLIALEPQAMAQRGGRGGGGGGRSGGSMQRSGGGGQRGGSGGSALGGGGMQRGSGNAGGGFGGGSRSGSASGGGGFGGGLSASGSPGRAQPGSAAMGPFGAGGSDQAAGQASSGRGAGQGGAPAGAASNARQVPGQPGQAAAATNGNVARANSNNTAARAGTSTQAASASQVNVNAGTAAAGTTTAPAATTTTAPGTRANGALAADQSTNGTHYKSAAVLANQSNSFHGGAVGYQSNSYAYAYHYNTSSYAAYPTAWQPTNVVSSSLYTHPGYGALAKGLGLAAQPTTYDYGANVVAQSNAVYVNGDAAATPDQYTEQASQIASAGQATEVDPNSKWLPLGIFAVVEGDATTSDNIFQLAVNPAGVIRGNYHNLKTNQMESLAGSVDKATERAAWTIAGHQAPVYEAGIANLTLDATPMLVHTADGQQQQVTLIRLQEPPAVAAGSAPAAAP